MTFTFKRSSILISIIVIGIITTTSSIPKVVNADNPGPFFSISVLSPNTNPARNQWATYLVEQLPKIGIAVDVFDLTGWAQISPRTWGYAGPYPVPTYAEGGFDVVCLAWTLGIDVDLSGMFNSDAITPDGNNYYQYSNPEMDQAINNFTQAFTLDDKIACALSIQDILYEELPSISIIYPQSVYCFDENLIGWNGVLWQSASQPMNNWSILGQTEFHYAVPADFEDFHIQTYISNFDASWLHQIYNGLLERDSTLDYTYSPWLAESISSSDGQTYSVVIKDAAVWADGLPVTTDDIIYNYRLAVTPALGGTSYSSNIAYWDNDSITKINDKEFTIDFLAPYVFQESNLGLDLIPPQVWEAIAPADHQNIAANWAKSSPEKLFGAGPYKLHSYNDINNIIHLKKNPYFDDWFGTEPYFDDIYFEFKGSKEGALAALAAGDIDMVDAQFNSQLDEIDIPGISYELVAGLSFEEIGVNMEHPWIGTGELCPIAGPESAKHVRKAISHAIDRSYISDEIYNGLATPAITPYHSTAVGFNERLTPYTYNLEWSLWHMAQAGFNVNTTFIPPNTSLPPLTPTNTDATLNFNLSIFTFIGIIAFIGGSIILLRYRKK
ncbi:MAG TPA: ABC transporter substrate-binding protein [candidate division Zixibacteria bacterium]|nr:ABC transporter substrate-binding protein [candidate division Zixibacteria bacterium]